MRRLAKASVTKGDDAHALAAASARQRIQLTHYPRLTSDDKQVICLVASNTSVGVLAAASTLRGRCGLKGWRQIWP